MCFGWETEEQFLRRIAGAKAAKERKFDNAARDAVEGTAK